MKDKSLTRVSVFLTSQIISLFGSAIVSYSIVWYITLKTSSTMALAISIVCTYMPQIVISMFSGTWGDKFNKKNLIIIGDTITGISTLILAILFINGFDSLYLLYGACALRSVGSGIQTPLEHAFLPLICPEEKLTKINGIYATASSAINILSPAMAGVLLVFQMGQPRIWMSMSRDGLLPKKFSKVHPKYKTPSYATIVTGFVVAVPALFLNLTMVTDLCSIGTLFAFVLVCAGVLVLQNKKDIPRGKFKTPYFNAKYVFPLLIIFGLVFAFTAKKEQTMAFFTNEKQINDPTTIVTTLTKEQTATVHDYLEKNVTDYKNSDLENVLDFFHNDADMYKNIVDQLPLDDAIKYESGFSLFKHKIPMWIFLISLLFFAVWSWKENLSLIPLLGLVSCLYMMAELSVWNWIYFTCWLLIGLLIYFGFSYKNSKLN